MKKYLNHSEKFQKEEGIQSQLHAKILQIFATLSACITFAQISLYIAIFITAYNIFARVPVQSKNKITGKV